ncbi:MAG: ankyrin repeat domain-containing protein [Candidatus Aminicenantaceae bacterium]
MKLKKIRLTAGKFMPALIVIIMLISYITALSVPENDIHEAAKQGDLAKIKALLEKDPNLVSVKDGEGETPLFRAAESGHLDVVQYLVAKGAQVNAKNNVDQTALFYSAYYGQADILDWLLSKGAEFKGIDMYGRSPLHYAAREGKKDATKILVEKGLDINLEDGSGVSPLRFAVDRGHLDVIDVFIALKALNPSEDSGRLALHTAAANGHKDVVSLLISKGADIRTKSDDGGTLLHNAVIGNLLELSRQLIKKGTEVNAQNRKGRTPLHYAVREGHLEIVKILVEKGAELNIRGNDSRTPLHIAEDWEHKEIIDFLAAKGVKELKRAVPKNPNLPWVGISYIANEGFLIASKTKKVLVDALFKNPYGYSDTPPKVFEMIVNSRRPFDRVDLILVSHAHRDHFEPNMAAEILMNHPETVLVGNEITIQELKEAAGENYSKISSQVKNINPEWGTIVEEKTKGIYLKIFAVNHAMPPREYVTLAYIFDLDGLKVFHLGDSVPASNEKYFESFQLQKEGIDVAFLDPFITQDEIGKKIVREYIQPKQIIPMHMRSSEIENFARELKKSYPNINVFWEPLEKKFFEQESR